MDGGETARQVEIIRLRADFLKDKSKPTRMLPESGMGERRWYLAPPGVATRDDFEERWSLGWGLAEWDGGPIKRIRSVVQPAPFNDFAWRHERSLLAQEIRRSDKPGPKWGPKRFRPGTPPIPKQAPCRGSGFCDGCGFCMPGLSPEEIEVARAVRSAT